MELTVEQALQQGIAAHKDGKLEEAERLYRAILQSHPAHPDANHNLGVLAVSVNKAEEALPLFKTALEANPKIEQFWLSYADALIKEQQYEAASQVIAEAQRQGFPGENLNALGTQLAQAADGKVPPQDQLNGLLEHYQAGRHADAEKLAISITQQYPEHQFGWKVLGAVLQQTGRKSEAVVANQRAVDLSPNQADAHNNLGVTLKEVGKLDASEASLRQAIILKPNFAEAHSNLGNTLQDLGRLDEAEISYKKAIALEPYYTEAHNNLGLVLKELGRLDEAETSYKVAIALSPEHFEAHNNLGKLLMQTGRYKDGLNERIKGSGVISFDLKNGISIK